VALKHENTEDHLHILIDSSLCINTIRNYIIDPTSYKHHLHKDLIQLTDQLLRDRASNQLRTHMGKVKSHTNVEYNETADTAARGVVDGVFTSDITFDEAGGPPNRRPTHLAANKTHASKHTG